MPLLKWVVDQHFSTQPLRGWHVLFIQHQLENHLAQLEAILRLGANASEVYWIDVPYTSSPEIRRAAMDLGVPEANFTNHAYKLTQQYARYQRIRVGEWISRFLDRCGHDARLLVLDDGGYFLEALIWFRRQFARLAVVEQTMRGISKVIENKAIGFYCRNFPIVDVARAKPKKTIEPRFIASAVRNAIAERLDAALLDAHVALSAGDVLVLGYGAIGKEVAREIRERFSLRSERVYVFDVDRQKCADAASSGYSIWDMDDFATTFQLVIGCTGTQAFNIWNYVHLAKRSILISASSGSIELGREEFVELADSTSVHDIHIHDRTSLESRDIHSDITFTIIDRVVTLANGGFPINFDGVLNRIPPEEIQITVAMMVYGAVQAVTTEQRGIIALDPAFCDELADRFEMGTGWSKI